MNKMMEPEKLEEIKKEFETINDSINELGLRFRELNETLRVIEKDARFFVELVEECLPLDDYKKRILHERAEKRMWIKDDKEDMSSWRMQGMPILQERKTN